jgi:hypothetical protein
LQFVAVDAPAYEQVIAGATANVHLPPEMLQDAQQPLPAIVSPQGTAGAKGVGVGGTFTLVVEGYSIQFRVAEVRDSWPGMAPEPDVRRRLRDQSGRSAAGPGPTSTAEYLRAPASCRAGPAGDPQVAPSPRCEPPSGSRRSRTPR